MVICVTDRTRCEGDFPQRLHQIAWARPHAVLLREKDLSTEEYEELAVKCKCICDNLKVMLILHTHVEVARRAGISRIHITLKSLEEMAGKLGDFEEVGTSVHSVDEAIAAQHMGASYLIAGHIYATDCKMGVPARGLKFLRDVCDAVQVPVFAIGGINRKRIAAVRNCGASGICVMSGLMRCDDPGGVCKKLVESDASYR